MAISMFAGFSYRAKPICMCSRAQSHVHLTDMHSTKKVHRQVFSTGHCGWRTPVARRLAGRGSAHAQPERDLQRQLLPGQPDQPPHCAGPQPEEALQPQAWQPGRVRVEAPVCLSPFSTCKALQQRNLGVPASGLACSNMPRCTSLSAAASCSMPRAFVTRL